MLEFIREQDDLYSVVDNGHTEMWVRTYEENYLKRDESESPKEG